MTEHILPSDIAEHTLSDEDQMIDEKIWLNLVNGCSLSVEPCEASLIGVVFEGKWHVSHSGKLSAVTRTIYQEYCYYYQYVLRI